MCFLFLFLESLFRPFTNTCFTYRQTNARYEFDDAQNSERIKDRGHSSGKVEAKRKPTPIVFFDEHIANLENEMDKIERKTAELALALRAQKLQTQWPCEIDAMRSWKRRR